MTSKIKKIGVITSVHGVRGQVKVYPLTDDPKALFSTVLSDASGKRQFKLKREGVKDKLFIASIDGITDRNDAELLKNIELFAPASEHTSVADTLTGLEARLLDGNKYGRVIGVYNFGAGDILDIELTNGKTEMLPLREEFVGDINVNEGSLVVYPPDYVEAK